MKKNIFLALGVLFGSVAVHAQEVSCTMGKLTRKVYVETSSESSCNTVYKKPTEGVGDQVIWSSDYSIENCQQRADRMIEKLSGWGWNCDRLSYAGSAAVIEEPTTIETVAPAVEKSSSSLLDKAKAAGSSAMEKTGAGSMLDKAKAAGSSAMEKTGAGSMLDKAKGAAGSVKEGVTGDAGSMLDKAKGAASDAGTKMLEKAKGVTSDAGSSMLDKAKGAAGSVKEGTGDAGSSMLDKAKGAAGSVKEGATKAVEKAPTTNK